MKKLILQLLLFIVFGLASDYSIRGCTNGSEISGYSSKGIIVLNLSNDFYTIKVLLPYDELT